MLSEDPKKKNHSSTEVVALSPRQQQVMDILYSKAPITARGVWEIISDQPSYASVRTTLRSLVEAGHVTYVKEKKTFVYSPTVSTELAAESALGKLVATFYRGSVARAVSGLLGLSDKKLNHDELEQLAKLIEETKNKER